MKTVTVSPSPNTIRPSPLPPPVPPHPAEAQGGNGKDTTQPTLTYQDLEKRLIPYEREELLRRFAHIKDVPFTITEHHPLLQQYFALVAPYINAKPQTILTPFLSACAANIGNKAYVPTYGHRTYCNIWTIIMGPSSITKKSTSIEQAIQPLYDYDAELEQQYADDQTAYNALSTAEQADAATPDRKFILLPEGSTEAFLRVLCDNPTGLIVHQEISSFLSKMNKSYNGDFKQDMMTWFDSPRVKIRVTGGNSTTRNTAILKSPAFSVATATTKEGLLAELKDHDFKSGFVQRFLLCNSQDVDRKDINCRIIETETQAQQANNFLAQLYAGLRLIGTVTDPMKVSFSKEALDLHEAANAKALDQIFNDANNLLFSYWSRVFTGYFVRLCILFTLAEFVLQAIETEADWQHAVQNAVPWDFTVSEKTAAYVIKLCHFYFQNIRAFLQNEASQTFQGNERRIVNVFYDHLAKFPEKIISRSFLKLKSNIRTTKDFDDALASLAETGVIFIHPPQKTENSKKRKQLYTLTM